MDYILTRMPQFNKGKRKGLFNDYDKITRAQKLNIFLYHQGYLPAISITETLDVSVERLYSASVVMFGKRDDATKERVKKLYDRGRSTPIKAALSKTKDSSKKKLSLSTRQKSLIQRLLSGSINGKYYGNIPVPIVAKLTGCSSDEVRQYANYSLHIPDASLDATFIVRTHHVKEQTSLIGASL